MIVKEQIKASAAITLMVLAIGITAPTHAVAAETANCRGAQCRLTDAQRFNANLKTVWTSIKVLIAPSAQAAEVPRGPAGGGKQSPQAGRRPPAE